MDYQKGLPVIELVMLLLVFAIFSVVAFPKVSSKTNTSNIPITNLQHMEKVNTAFALAIAKKGDFPSLLEIIPFIDAEFVYYSEDYSGIVFTNDDRHAKVQTFFDLNCKQSTTLVKSGETDIVRCIGSKLR